MLVSGGKKIAVRNPHSTRPYQHVLEPLGAYLLIAEEQYQDSRKAGSYNVGPDDRSCLTTGELADLFCTAWGNGAAWENLCQGGPHEANFLKLDCSRIRNRLGWKPRWQVDEAVVNTAKWYQAWLAHGQNMAEYTDCQTKNILEYKKYKRIEEKENMKKNREVICAFAAWVLSACFFMSCFMIPGLAEKINSLGNSNMLVYGMSLILFCLLFVVGMGIAHRHEVAGKTFPENVKARKTVFWLMLFIQIPFWAALYLRRDGTAWICGGEIRDGTHSRQ